MEHAEICNLWPSISALADDMGEKAASVYKWRERNRIPPEHWQALVAKARKRKIYLTYEMLVRGLAA